jgi:desulfoferrodoxin (superoxide reductase-like protein)
MCGKNFMGGLPNLLVIFAAIATNCSASSTQRGPTSSDTTPSRVRSGSNDQPAGAKTDQNIPEAKSTATVEEPQRDKLLTGGPIYTAQQPGIYANLVSTHLGILSLTGGKLKVVIDHEQVKGSYIHWVQLRTLAGDILWEKEYVEPEAAAISTKFAPVEIDVSGMQLKSQQILYFYSSCGQHGIWRAEFKIP